MITTRNFAVQAWHFLLIIGSLCVFMGLYMFVFAKNEAITLSGMLFTIGGLMTIVFTLFNYQSIFDRIWYLIYGILICSIGCYMVTYTGDSPYFVLSGATLFVSVVLLGTGYDLSVAGVHSRKRIMKSCTLGVVFSILSFPESVFALLSIITLGISLILLSLEFKRINHISQRISKQMKKL